MTREHLKIAAATFRRQHQAQLFMLSAVLIPLLIAILFLISRNEASLSAAQEKAFLALGCVVLALSWHAGYYLITRQLSISHGLVCTQCHKPLGSRLAHLELTGRCESCEAQLVNAA
jgi:hypothetical protein